jgi:hypothetical protein
VELVEVGEFQIGERFELTAEYEVEKLLGRPGGHICAGHDRSLAND